MYKESAPGRGGSFFAGTTAVSHMQMLHILLTGHKARGGCGGLKTSSYANNIQLNHHSLRD